MKKICLGDVIEVIHGWAFKGEFFSAEGEKLVVTPGNFFEKGGFRERKGKEKFYLSKDFPKKYLLDKHDLIVAMTEQGEGLLGSSALIPENDKYLHNQRIGKICIKKPNLIDKYYLYFLFNTLSVRKQISNSASGTKVKHTAPERIYRVEVYLPSLENQLKISNLLMSIEELEESNNNTIGILTNIIEALYQEWFINFKFPNHEQVNFVDGIPERWKECCLKEVIKTNPSTMKKGEFANILYVDISSIGEGKIESVTQYSPADAPGRAKRKVQHGDVIWSCVRPNRKQFALIQNPQENLIVSTGFTVLRPTKIPFSFLASMAARDDFSGYLTSVAQGAAYPAVTYKDFEEFEFLLPTDDLLDKYHEVTQPMYEQINILQAQNEKLKELKETLLPRLMSGELDISKNSSIE